MQAVRQTPKHELVASCLVESLREGRWSGNLPGVARLAADLDVSPHTVRRALRQLELQGSLTSRGPGRCRGIITDSASGVTTTPLRVGIMRFDESLAETPQTAAILIDILHSLEAAGHVGFLSKKSQIDLRHDVRRIASHMAQAPADAWVIEGGSRELLEWCAAWDLPCLALYGRSDGLPMARTGPDKEPALRAATRHLLAFGHRRIVLIVRAGLREPSPGKRVRAFLDELNAHGIATSDYHLPGWEESPEGFSKLLERLFLFAPPTAMIVDEAARYIAAAEFLARRGILVPQKVSLVSTDNDAALTWCRPPVAHMRWDSGRIVRRVMRWVAAVRHGKPDRRTIYFPVEFIPGGSIGPVDKG